MTATLFMIELTVADLALSMAWYRDRFSFPVVILDETNSFALLDAGTCRLALKQGTPAPGTTRVVFASAHLNEVIASFASLGDHPVRPVKLSHEGYREALFHDPDGHAVAVFEWVHQG